MFALSKTDNELILIIQRLMKKLLSVLILLGAYLTVFSQNIQVTGTVIGGSDREPLPGVNVVVKDATANGTITDLDGKLFSLYLLIQFFLFLISAINHRIFR